mmetsp:Transcript_56044/g.164556  ORF Transcript_56044/g.164556 Transcript_56044/m.164556 type:complete len:205 (-) Transcript_56044:64-678(-)
MHPQQAVVAEPVRQDLPPLHHSEQVGGLRPEAGSLMRVEQLREGIDLERDLLPHAVEQLDGRPRGALQPERPQRQGEARGVGAHLLLQGAGRVRTLLLRAPRCRHEASQDRLVARGQRLILWLLRDDRRHGRLRFLGREGPPALFGLLLLLFPREVVLVAFRVAGNAHRSPLLPRRGRGRECGCSAQPCRQERRRQHAAQRGGG